MGNQTADTARRHRDRFIGFAFASADLLLELGGDLGIRWAGGAARTLLGMQAEEAVGAAVSEFLSRLDAMLLGTALRQLNPGERQRGLKLTLVDRTGAAHRADICLYRGLDESKPEFFAAISLLAGDAPRSSAAHRRDRTTGLIEAVEFAESTAGALRSARESGKSARLTLVQICGEAELDHILGRERVPGLDGGDRNAAAPARFDGFRGGASGRRPVQRDAT